MLLNHLRQFAHKVSDAIGGKGRIDSKHESPAHITLNGPKDYSYRVFGILKPPPCSEQGYDTATENRFSRLHKAQEEVVGIVSKNAEAVRKACLDISQMRSDLHRNIDRTNHDLHGRIRAQSTQTDTRAGYDHVADLQQQKIFYTRMQRFLPPISGILSSMAFSFTSLGSLVASGENLLFNLLSSSLFAVGILGIVNNKKIAVQMDLSQVQSQLKSSNEERRTRSDQVLRFARDKIGGLHQRFAEAVRTTVHHLINVQEPSLAARESTDLLSHGIQSQDPTLITERILQRADRKRLQLYREEEQNLFNQNACYIPSISDHRHRSFLLKNERTDFVTRLAAYFADNISCDGLQSAYATKDKMFSMIHRMRNVVIDGDPALPLKLIDLFPRLGGPLDRAMRSFLLSTLEQKDSSNRLARLDSLYTMVAASCALGVAAHSLSPGQVEPSKETLESMYLTQVDYSQVPTLANPIIHKEIITPSLPSVPRLHFQSTYA